MKRIDKWVATDGSEFDTQEEALGRELLLDKINAIEKYLPKSDSSSSFGNGLGYIQHSKEDILWARRMLVSLAYEYVSTELSKYDVKDYGFGRTLDDSGSPLYKLFDRIVSCIDDLTWREYGQPYFAYHPEKAKQICLNGES